MPPHVIVYFGRLAENLGRLRVHHGETTRFIRTGQTEPEYPVDTVPEAWPEGDGLYFAFMEDGSQGYVVSVNDLKLPVPVPIDDAAHAGVHAGPQPRRICDQQALRLLQACLVANVPASLRPS